MRAVRPADAGVVVADAPDPGGPGETVEVVASGICGSDLHLL